MTNSAHTSNRIGVALNPMGYPHYTDHLAAIAVTMQIPLVFTDIDHYEQSLRLYPNLDVQLHDWQEFTPRYIVEHYDVLFVSEMWNRMQLKARFEAHEHQLNKRIRVVHCPHGFSDKGFWFEQCLDQDITLVYGQNMLDLISARRPGIPLQSHVIVGNLRYSYYKDNQAFFDKSAEAEVFSRFARKQATILYAPTWRDAEDSTSFFEAAETLLSNLPDHYNLLVKLHPNLEHDHDHMVRVYEIISKYEDKSNVVMLSEYPLIYPLAAACDLYIGDRSAVGYDFLAFDKPMFFLSQAAGVIFQCGEVIAPEQYDRIYDIIEESLKTEKEKFSAIRKQVYNYTFAAERPFEQVRQEIMTICSDS